MEVVQINPMGVCIAGIAAIGAFVLVCFVWRHRIRNAAVAVLAAVLALVAIPKNDRQAIGRAGSPMSAAMPRDGLVETPHVSAINVSTSGVDLVLFRPAADSISSVEVTVAAKTNLAEHAAWFAVTNATFLAGDTNVFVSIARETLDGFGVTSPAFFSFGGSGDTDGDGLLDWSESLNFGTSPYLVDTDGDGIGDAEELAMGTDPTTSDTDGDGLSDLEEIGKISVLPTFEWHDTSSFPRTYGVPPPHGIEPYSGAIATLLLPSGTSMLGFAFSRVVACDNGFVSLLLPEDWVSWSFPSPPHSLAIRGFNLGTVLVAPYWGPGRAEYGNPNSYICAGTLVDGTLVVEFHNVKCGFQSDDAMTYQVIVPCGAGNVVRVSYLSSDMWMDGTGAVVGVQNAIRATPDGLYNLTWDFSERGPILSGTTVEYRIGEGTDPLSADSDGDGLDDFEECRIAFSAPWSADGDDDGILDGVEIILGTNPLKSDSDGDLLPDGWEFAHGLDPLSADGINGTFGDPDGDGLHNYREMQLGTNPSDMDTDGDGMPDDWELDHSFDPLHAGGVDGEFQDSDGDGLINGEEFAHGTDPHDWDSDGDGMGDGWEVEHGFDPATNNDYTARMDDDANADPDGDGADNLQEAEWGMDPFDTSDGGMPADLVAVSFTFGDHSSSQSDRYSLSVRPLGGGVNAPKSYSWSNPAAGVCSMVVAQLRRGWTYEVKLVHMEDGSVVPFDYDYTFLCDAPDEVCVDDPDGMLGEHEYDVGFPFKSGLTLAVGNVIPQATTSGMDVSVVAECGTVLFENGYVNAPGEVMARKSTWTRVCVDFSSGISSVQGLFMAASGGCKVILHDGSHVGAALDGVQTVELAPYSSRRLLYYVEGCMPSEAVNDVLLFAQISDGVDTCNASAAMTVGCVGLTAEYNFPVNKTRHVFGPAEPTKLSVTPQTLLASLEVVGQIPHGSIERNNDNSYKLIVSDRRSRFELGVRYDNALLKLPFSVIEPERKFRAVNGMALDKDSWFLDAGGTHPPSVGQIGVGLYVELYLEPSYVSFQSLCTMELSVPATKLTGEFREIAERHPGIFDHDIAAGAENGGVFAHLVDEGNCAGSDVASYVDRERMLVGKKGGYSWIIPSVWYTWNNTYTGRFETVEQRFELEENGDMKVTKYGFWAKRSKNGMVSPKAENAGH